MPQRPEDIAREQIAKRGVAIREFDLKPDFGAANYLVYVDGKAAGVIEAKKAGDTLTGVEIRSAKYSKGLPDALPAWTYIFGDIVSIRALKASLPGQNTNGIMRNNVTQNSLITNFIIMILFFRRLQLNRSQDNTLQRMKVAALLWKQLD